MWAPSRPSGRNCCNAREEGKAILLISAELEELLNLATELP